MFQKILFMVLNQDEAAQVIRNRDMFFGGSFDELFKKYLISNGVAFYVNKFCFLKKECQQKKFGFTNLT